MNAIHGTGAVAMRLMEIGLVPGRQVSILRRAPFGGPLELLIDQTRVAVRIAEADGIEVSTSSHIAEPVPTPVSSKVVTVA